MLWLWNRLAATALIRPLAWEFPYAMGAAFKSQKKKKKKGRNKKLYYYTATSKCYVQKVREGARVGMI